MIVAIVAGCGGFWVLLIALVKHEKGWVGLTDHDRFRLRIRSLLTGALLDVGDWLNASLRGLARAAKRAGKDMEAFNRSMAEFPEDVS